MIWLAYFLIPAIILNFTSKKKTGLKFHSIYFLFAAFILLCGLTHALDAVMFWVPLYRLNALLRFTTGVVSLLTVYYLIKILPAAFSQPTNLELETEITRREEAEHKLAAANKELQSFASIASHDLQEPLRKVRIFSSLLTNANSDKLDNASKEYLDKIVGSSKKMQNLIQDLLTLSTINDEIELKKSSVNAAVDSASETLEIKILEKGAVINSGPIPPVIGNEAYLSQVFYNLLNNAIKFSDVTPAINIKGERKDNKVFVYVSDNGIGMKREDTGKIFQAFQRIHSKAKYEGSGIGLSICKKIMDIHKGKISVESIPGEGTTFILEFQAA